MMKTASKPAGSKRIRRLFGGHDGDPGALYLKESGSNARPWVTFQKETKTKPQPRPGPARLVLLTNTWQRWAPRLNPPPLHRRRHRCRRRQGGRGDLLCSAFIPGGCRLSAASVSNYSLLQPGATNAACRSWWRRRRRWSDSSHGRVPLGKLRGNF